MNNDIPKTRLKDILEKPKLRRTDEDIEYLINFYSDFKFVKETIIRYGDSVLRDIFQCLTYITAKPGINILSYGDYANECYLLFEGELEVWMLDSKCKEVQKKFWTFSKVASIDQGVLFGEKALIDKKPRTATIKSKTYSILGKLTKKDFFKILQNRKKDDNDKEIKFYRSMALFKNCSKNFIEQFTYCMQPLQYKREDIIIDQGEYLDSIYFVRKGIFQVLYTKNNKLNTEIDLNYLSLITSINERFTEDKQYELKGCIISKDIHKVFNLGEGEIIGDLEMIHPVEFSYFRIKCLQDDSILLQSKRQLFLEYLGKTKNDLILQAKEKLIKYNERLEDIEKFKKSYIDNNGMVKKYYSLLNKVDDYYIKKSKITTDNKKVNPIIIQVNKSVVEKKTTPRRISVLFDSYNFSNKISDSTLSNSIFNSELSKKSTITSDKSIKTRKFINRKLHSVDMNIKYNEEYFRVDKNSAKKELKLNTDLSNYNNYDEINKNFFLDNNAISSLLSKKYDFMRKISSAKNCI